MYAFSIKNQKLSDKYEQTPPKKHKPPLKANPPLKKMESLQTPPKRDFGNNDNPPPPLNLGGGGRYVIGSNEKELIMLR